MRSQASDPYQVDDFLDAGEIAALLALFAAAPSKEEKTTGPVCAPYSGQASLDRKIRDLVGDRPIHDTSLFFQTEVPHVLHCDSSLVVETTPGKAILLPLAYDANRAIEPLGISFFVFQQRWYGYPAKFFKGEANIVSPYNRPVYRYDGLEGLGGGAEVEEEARRRWLSHLKAEWLEGLSLFRQFDWKIGSAIVFDSFQVHCGSDFRRYGVKSKIGLSVFTGPPPRQ